MIKIREEDLRALKTQGEVKGKTLGERHRIPTRGEDLATAQAHTESPLMDQEEELHLEEHRWTLQRVQEGELLQKNKGLEKLVDKREPDQGIDPLTPADLAA